MSAGAINNVKVVVVSHKVFCQLFGMVQERPSLRISSPRFESGETPDLIAVEVDGIFAFKGRRGEGTKTSWGESGWLWNTQRWTVAYDPDVITFESGETK